MNYYIIPAAMLVAILFSFLFAYLAPGPRPFRGLFFFFFILFLVGWAGQLWIVPFGPLLWGVAFFPLFFLVAVVSFIMMAVLPPTPAAKENPPVNTNAAVIAFGLFFWFLVITLVASIIIGYYRVGSEGNGPA